MIKQRRGQGIDPTPEQVATERARARVAAELVFGGHSLARPVDVLWSPEQTAALRALLAGKGVTR
jgi:hypothetical protein